MLCLNRQRNKMGPYRRGWVCVTDGETVGCMRKETDLIFSNVTQSSEVLAVPLRLYDTMMLGSA